MEDVLPKLVTADGLVVQLQPQSNQAQANDTGRQIKNENQVPTTLSKEDLRTYAPPRRVDSLVVPTHQLAESSDSDGDDDDDEDTDMADDDFNALNTTLSRLPASKQPSRQASRQPSRTGSILSATLRHRGTGSSPFHNNNALASSSPPRVSSRSSTPKHSDHNIKASAALSKDELGSHVSTHSLHGQQPFSATSQTPNSTQQPTYKELFDKLQEAEQRPGNLEARDIKLNIPFDEDANFDWEKDEDVSTIQEDPNELYSPCWRWWHQLSQRVRKFIIYTVLIIICISPTVVLAALGHLQDDIEKGNSNFKTMVWSLFCVYSIIMYACSKTAVQVILVLIKMNIRVQWEEKLEYVIRVRKYLVLILWFTVLHVGWTFTINSLAECTQDSSCPLWWLQNVMLGFIISSILFFVEKLFVHHVAKSFHRTAYEDRLKSIKFAQAIIERLNNARKSHKIKSSPWSPPMDPKSNYVLHRKDQLAESSPESSPKRDIYEVQSPKSSIMKRSSNKFMDIWRKLFKASDEASEEDEIRTKIKNLTDFGTKEEASKVARKLFEFLSKPDRPYLLPEDFLPYFRKVEPVFTLFDKNGNGNVSKKEMKEAVVWIFKERQTLNESVLCIEDVLGRLDLILCGMVFFLSIFIWLAIFQISVSGIIVSLTSALVTFTFVFGNTARTTFENLVFVLSTHPYDVGDRIVMDGESFFVLKIHLLSTLLRKSDGSYLYASNTLLMNKFISNIRRSQDMSDTTVIEIPLETPSEKIHELKAQIINYTKTNSLDFTGKAEIGNITFEAPERLRLTIVVQHRGNFMDGTIKSTRRIKFILFLKDICEQLGIKFFMPMKHDVSITHTDRSQYNSALSNLALQHK